MRWNAAPPSRFDGALAAVPVMLQSREEDVYHPVHLYSRSRKLPSKAAIPYATCVAPRNPRCPTMAMPTETINLSETIIQPPPQQHKPRLSARLPSPRSESLQDEPQSGRLVELSDGLIPKFLVCAGRGFNAELPHGLSNNHDDGYHADADEDAGAYTGRSVESASEPPLKSQRGLQRSDSELELIIHELREKIALQQRQQTPCSADDDSAAAAGSSRPKSGCHHQHMHQQQHSRKHLKNPLEKMHMASSSSSNLLLRRQASASEATASRLVSEGTASMVTPAVLSSSASRGAIGSHLQQTQQTPTLLTVDVVEASKTRDKHCHEQAKDCDSLRIRSYATGSDSATSQMPQFVSSTSLGLHPPSHQQPVRCQSSAIDSVQPACGLALLRRVSRPRLHTLEDLELEFERLHDDTRATDTSGSISPVGPWFVDGECISSAPLMSSRSTSSLVSSSASSPLPFDDSALSPRSRLLWLSACGSEDAWDAKPARVVALLRPGPSVVHPRGSRPVSALETRRLSDSRHVAKAKPRAVSAKVAAPASRRKSSSHSSGSHSRPTHESIVSNNQQRTRSISSSTASTSSSSTGRPRIQ